MPILETLKGAWELASGLGNALSKMSALEAKQAVLDLQNVLGKIQAEAFELQQQNHELRDRIRETEAAAKAARQIVHEDNICWRQTENGREGPLCPACYDNSGKVIYLTDSGTKGYYSCAVCKNGFQTSEYKNPPPISTRRRRTWR